VTGLTLLVVFVILVWIALVWWLWRRAWRPTPGSSFAGSYSADPLSTDEAVMIAATTAAVLCASGASW
jgi:cytoskeletal protein RodZ